MDDVKSVSVKLTNVRIDDVFYSNIEFVVTDYNDIATIYDVDKKAKSSKNVAGINLAPWTATFQYQLVSGDVVHEYSKIGNDTSVFKSCLSYVTESTEN